MPDGKDVTGMLVAGSIDPGFPVLDGKSVTGMSVPVSIVTGDAVIGENDLSCGGAGNTGEAPHSPSYPLTRKTSLYA